MNIAIQICALLIMMIPSDVESGDGTEEVGGNGKDTALIINIKGQNKPPNIHPIKPIKRIINDDKMDIDPIYPDICADTEVVLDYSCSLSPAIKDRARNTSKAIGYFLFDYDPKLLTSRLGIITYGQEVTRVKNLDENTTAPGIVDIFNAIDEKRKQGTLCRTHTHLALQEVERSFSTYNRPGVKQIVLLFTDGLTFMRRNRASMYIAADRLKKSGVIIYVTRLPHKRGKFQNDEYVRVPHSSKHLFNGTDNNITNFIVSQMRIDAPCPGQP